MKRWSIAIVVALSVVPSIASAQVLNPARFDNANHVISGAFGLDGPITSQVGYAPILPVGILDGRLALPLTFSLPIRPGPGDWGASAGAQLASIGNHGFGISGRVDFTVRQSWTEVARYTRLGGGVTLLGGYFRERGSVALELAWEPGFGTRVSPTDMYKRDVYAGAHATWFGFGNGIYRAGVQGNLRIVGNTEVTLKTGITRSERLNATDMMPFYAMVGVNQGF